MQDMINISRKRRRDLVLERDDYSCGIHLDGCSERLTTTKKGLPKSELITLDHIVPKSWWKDRQPVSPEYYNQEWNLQPMHRRCNDNDKRGQIYGFPVFTCRCHWLRIDKTEKGHILVLLYRKGNTAFGNQISTERDLLVISKQDLENSINLEPGESLVEMPFMVLSLANHKPGVKGITGPGYAGHGLPALSPEQVLEFNQLELQRIAGAPVETIAKFNPQPDDEAQIKAIHTI